MTDLRRSSLRSRFARITSATLASGALLAAPSIARADDTIKSPGDHPDYPFEIEPHLAFGDDGVWAAGGYGIGARLGIPVVKNGFVPQINNSVAVSVGIDMLRYDQCYFDQIGCGSWFLQVPVALQWNFYVARQFSVFGEPGLFIYRGFFDAGICDGQGNNCHDPSLFGIRPSLEVGGRWHFSDKAALTLRVGYPTITVGISIF